MIQLSHSKLNNYRVCPYKFFLLEELRKAKAKPIAPVNFRRYVDGWVAHRCMELWHTKGDWAKGWMQNVILKPCLDEKGRADFEVIGISNGAGNLVSAIMTEYLKENFVEWRHDTDKAEVEGQLNEGLSRIEDGVYSLDLNTPATISEQWFRVTITDTNICLLGRIDLIDTRYPDIHDLKWTLCESVDWDQLLLYDLCITIWKGKKVRKVGAFTPLLPRISEMREYSVEEQKDFVEELKAVEDVINSGEYELKGATTGKCSTCEVRAECKERNG